MHCRRSAWSSRCGSATRSCWCPPWGSWVWESNRLRRIGGLMIAEGQTVHRQRAMDHAGAGRRGRHVGGGRQSADRWHQARPRDAPRGRRMSSNAVRGAPLLEVEQLGVTFLTPRGTVRAVRDASLNVRRGEVLGTRGRVGIRQVDHCVRRHGLPAGHDTGERPNSSSKVEKLRT